MTDVATRKGIHMMVNTSLLNLALFISDIAIPMYILSVGGTFIDVGWASACSFLCSGLGAYLFGNLGDKWGFGFIRFIVNSGIVVLYIILVSSTNIVAILVVYVVRGVVMQNVWVSFAYYGQNHRPQDALWFISTTLTLMYCAQVVAPLLSTVFIAVSSARITLIIALGVFFVVFLQSGHFANCKDDPDLLDDETTQIATGIQTESRSRVATISAETYKPDEEIESIREPESFLDLSIPRQMTIFFLVFEMASCTVMTVLLMTWYVVYARYILGVNVIIAGAQVAVYCVMTSLVSKFLPRTIGQVSQMTESSDNICVQCLTFIHTTRIVIASVGIFQILILTSMVASTDNTGTINTPPVWVGMGFLGLFQGIMYVIPSALLAEYAPKGCKYYDFVNVLSAFFKRSCAAVALFFVGFLLSDMPTVLFFVLQISLSFAPASVAVMYLCDCFESAETDHEYAAVPTTTASA